MADSMAGTENKAKRKLQFCGNISIRDNNNTSFEISEKSLKHVVIHNGIIILLSSLILIVRYSTDLIVSIEYFIKKYHAFGSLTIIFLIIPLIFVQLFSGRWYKRTNEITLVCLLSHIFLLQPYERYWRLGVSLAKVKKSNELKSCLQKQLDLSKLFFFLAFLGSAPQLSLQMYNLIFTDNWSWLTLCSAIFNAIAIVFSLGCKWFCSGQINSYEHPSTLSQLILIVGHHTALLTSRLIAIICLSLLLQSYVFIVLVTHIFIIFFWIILQKRDVCCSSITALFDNFVFSCIHVFIFYKVKEGSSRLRMMIFYSIVGTENFLFVIIWFLHHSSTVINIVLITLVFLNFFLGILLMLVYYRFFHPKGPFHFTSRKTLTLPQTPATPMPNSFQHYSIDTSACLECTEPENKFNLTDMIMNGTTSCESNSFIFGWKENGNKIIPLTPKGPSSEELESSYIS